MPEVILPCPACGGDCLIVAKNYPSGKWHTYCDCGHIGRFYPTREDAIKAHNDLPRALTWTHEPPKVAGWYFLKMSSGTISMVYLSGQDIKDKDWHGCIGQWVAIAGPIAPPVEA